jgi:hypothetical protein
MEEAWRMGEREKCVIAIAQKSRSEADTDVTDLIAGYKEIDCMYQLTGNDDQEK